MTDRTRRKALRTQYKQTHPEAGVYRIVNTQTNKALLGSSADLASVRSKMDFARSTNSAGVFDYRLRKDIQTLGIDAFSLEILEVLETRPEMTRQQILDGLATLESLWREQLDPASLY